MNNDDDLYNYGLEDVLVEKGAEEYDDSITSEYDDKIMRLEKALKDIIFRSHNYPIGTSKVLDMRAIAEKALEED